MTNLKNRLEKILKNAGVGPFGADFADRTSQKEFEVTSLTYCVFFVWLQADLLAVSFWSLAVQHNLLCRVHVEAVVLPRFMRSLH